MPFLRDELNLTYTVASYHFSSFALGMILLGSFGDRIMNNLPRHLTWWGGALGMGCGSVMFMLAERAEVSVVGTFVMGSCGSLSIATVRAVLANHHVANLSAAMTESAIFLSLAAGLGTFLVGFYENIGMGWRAAPSSMLFVGTLVWLVSRKAVIERSQLVRESHDSIDKGFLLIIAILILAAAVEWSMNFWGPEYITSVAGISKTEAAGVMSLYFGAMLSGRAFSRRFVHYATTARLLVGMTSLLMIAFVFFWLTPATIPGLLVIGFSTSTLLPLTMAYALERFPSSANLVAARVSFAAGIAIFAAPQALGRAADEIGIQHAYGIVGVFILIIWLMTAYLRQV